MKRSIALATGLLLLGTGLASAQTPPAQPKQPTPALPNTTTTTKCAQSGATTGSGQPGSNLSDKLAQSNGVICPPATADPGMQVAPPQGGALKVLPPPGTPGGDQRTIPK
jgi:hypothetical protein